MDERFVGCKEVTKHKAQMDAIPRQKRSVCGSQLCSLLILLP